MELNFGNLNWLAIIACIIVGQIFLTVWFLVIFGEPWAKAYGAADKKQHTAEIPSYTYGIGLVCMILLSFGLALFQQATGVDTLESGITFGIMIAIFFAIATALPGYAFQKRWSTAILAIGSQTVLIIILSAILGAWQ
ncbi:MAG: DUF1761 domain-containing protein [Alphaproteobacteria bacterium]|nr:DUF1761 domain-containing protein [Alphaproteobacteria bacterium]